MRSILPVPGDKRGGETASSDFRAGCGAILQDTRSGRRSRRGGERHGQDPGGREDDPNLRLLYEEELGAEGYEVILAENGPEALRQFKARQPKLVILDLALPGMDGIKVLDRLLAIDRTVAIIINIAYASYKDHFRTWAADAYLVNSGNLLELRQTIRRLLHERGTAEPTGEEVPQTDAADALARAECMGVC